MSALSEPEVCRNILESLPTGMCVIDMQKRIAFWSDGAERITGHLRHEVIGHSCVAEPLLHCDQPGCEFCGEECPAARAIKTSRPAEATGFLHHKAGHEIPVCIRAVPIHNERGSIIGAVETFETLDAAASPDDREAARQMPDFTDAVTGVASRAMMLSHLRRTMTTFTKVQVPFAVLLFRVEGLTHFRASLGLEAAASLLRVVARTLESSLWNTDFVGRWSDDQFLVIVGACHEHALGKVRERVRRCLAREGIEWWGERRSLPVSIGEAIAQPADSVELVLERAQKSLEAASASHPRAAQSSSAGS
jgi:diguanylate cyclase (GGDEF)-like protein/PAS domain S-box-containing protein